MASEKKFRSKADFKTNYATKESVAKRFFDEFTDRIQSARNNRLQLEELWLEDYRLWACQPNEEGYQGFANIFVPELNNQVESSIEKGHTALFPGSDYIMAVPMKATGKETAKKIQAAVQYELEQKIQCTLLYDQHLRQKVLLGTGPVKTGFRKDMVQAFRRTKAGRSKIVDVPRYWGTTCKSVNLFRWYIFPEMSTLDTCDFVFEEDMYSLATAKRDGIYANLDEVGPMDKDLDHDWIDLEKMEIDRLANALDRYKNCALFTEIWADFSLIEGEPPVPVQCVIANKSTVVLLRRNPYWFQTHPYDAARYVIRPNGSFYGLSLPDRIRDQQYAINDLMNQTMDSINYANNPIALIDPALAGDLNSMKVMPGAKWLGSPEGIEFRNFTDVSGTGLRGMQEVRGQIAQFSDNTPGIAPQLQGKSRSATQASIVQASVSGRQRIQGKIEETAVLSPVCRKIHILLQQFMDESFQIRKQGADNGEWIVEEVKPEDLVGDVDFLWRGQSEVEKTAVYTQQLLSLYGEALKTAAIMPGEVNLPKLFLRVAKEAFKIDGLEEIFKSEQMSKTINPDAENLALLEEQDLPVFPADDDAEHIQKHQIVADDQAASDRARVLAIKHIEKHRVQATGKKRVSELKSRVEALKAAQGMVEGETGPDQGQPDQAQPGAPQGPQMGDGRMGPQVPSVMEGNQSRVPTSPAGVFSGIQV